MGQQDGARTARQEVERWSGRGVWGREQPDVLVRELSAVLNLERRLPDAVRVARLGAACGTKPASCL